MGVVKNALEEDYITLQLKNVSVPLAFITKTVAASQNAQKDNISMS